MSDKDLTPVERELSETAFKLANAVASHGELAGYWAEELIPPMSEDDVLSSGLYPRLGSPVPRAGFTLHHGDKAYRVIVVEYEE